MPSSDQPRDLTPEQDAVRRLLAAARHDEPVPPAVAARLDAVLAELSADRRTARSDASPTKTAPAVGDGSVVDLRARRRRGIGTALAAAAAVVVAGVGIGQVLGGTSDVGSDASAGSDAEADGESGEAGGGSATFEGEFSEEDGGSASEPDGPTALDREQGATTAATVPELSSDTLRRDLRAALRAARASGPTASTLPVPGSACAPAEAALVGSGRQVPVTLDGRPALALYRVPLGARRQVDVYLCGTGVPAESVTLRAR